MIKKSFVLCLLLMSSGLSAKTISALEAQNILQMPTAKGQQKGVFEQKKYFKVLKKPFISSGKFMINDTRFSWQTLKPLPSGIEFDEKLYLINSSGERQVAPQGAYFATLLVAMLQGKLESLAMSFEFEQASVSCVKLHATEASIRGVLGAVSICNQGTDKQISFSDQHDNRTEITLTYEQ